MDKLSLRNHIQEKRNALSKQQVMQYSKIIQGKTVPFLRGTVALYNAFQNEVCVNELKTLVKQYALPIAKKNEPLQFYTCNENTKFSISSYGIQEPIDGILCDPTRFDVMVIPLVGFDEYCNRLGYGKGYYDAYLKHTNALKIGVAFECQKVDSIPIGPHDVALDMIITETNIYKKGYD